MTNMEAARTLDTKPNVWDLSSLQVVFCVSPETRPDAMAFCPHVKAILSARQLHGWTPQMNRQTCSEPNSASCDLECKGRFPQGNSISLSIGLVASMGMHAHMAFCRQVWSHCALVSTDWKPHECGLHGKKIHQNWAKKAATLRQCVVAAENK